MDGFTESIHNGKDGDITFWWWKTSNKIHSYVWPGVVRCGQGAEETSWCPVWCFATGTDGAGGNEFPGVPATMEGHQKCCYSRAKVLWKPGWQATFEECPHWRMADLKSGGTINRSRGHSLSVGWPCRASCTSCSIFHLAAPTTREDRMMVSSAESSNAGENCRERVLGLKFRDSRW